MNQYINALGLAVFLSLIGCSSTENGVVKPSASIVSEDNYHNSYDHQDDWEVMSGEEQSHITIYK